MYSCLGVGVVWCAMVYVCDVVCDMSDEVGMCMWCVCVWHSMVCVSVCVRGSAVCVVCAHVFMARVYLCGVVCMCICVWYGMCRSRRY